LDCAEQVNLLPGYACFSAVLLFICSGAAVCLISGVLFVGICLELTRGYADRHVVGLLMGAKQTLIFSVFLLRNAFLIYTS